MRPHTTYYTAMTLDGFLADEHDSLDWLMRQDIDEQGPMNYDEFIVGIGAIAMGATTYLWVRDHLERHGETWSYVQPSFVFTHRELPGIEGADIRFVQGPVASAYDDLAAVAGERGIWVVGGGDLAAQFAEAGLLDEVAVSIAPVTLGTGRPLFPRRFDLRLREVERNRAFVCARYDVVGAFD